MQRNRLLFGRIERLFRVPDYTVVSSPVLPSLWTAADYHGFPWPSAHRWNAPSVFSFGRSAPYVSRRDATGPNLFLRLSPQPLDELVADRAAGFDVLASVFESGGRGLRGLFAVRRTEHPLRHGGNYRQRCFAPALRLRSGQRVITLPAAYCVACPRRSPKVFRHDPHRAKREPPRF